MSRRSLIFGGLLLTLPGCLGNDLSDPIANPGLSLNPKEVCADGGFVSESSYYKVNVCGRQMGGRSGVDLDAYLEDRNTTGLGRRGYMIVSGQPEEICTHVTSQRNGDLPDNTIIYANTIAPLNALLDSYQQHRNLQNLPNNTILKVNEEGIVEAVLEVDGIIDSRERVYLTHIDCNSM